MADLRPKHRLPMTESLNNASESRLEPYSVSTCRVPARCCAGISGTSYDGNTSALEQSLQPTCGGSSDVCLHAHIVLQVYSMTRIDLVQDGCRSVALPELFRCPCPVLSC